MMMGKRSNLGRARFADPEAGEGERSFGMPSLQNRRPKHSLLTSPARLLRRGARSGSGSSVELSTGLDKPVDVRPPG